MQITAPKKVVNAWAMYDWSNSVYNLVITTTFFPIFFMAISYIVSASSKDEVHKMVMNFTAGKVEYANVKSSLDSASTILQGKVTKGQLLSFYNNRLASGVDFKADNSGIKLANYTELKMLFNNIETKINNDDSNGLIPFFGRQVKNTAVYNYALAIAYLLVIFMFPVLSAVADNKGNKKTFMKLFCYVGATACACFYFLNKDRINLALILVIIAAIGFYGSQLFYNAYLPEIAAEKDRDRISAKGYIFGYIGSVLMQLIGFGLVMYNKGYIGVTFLLVGLWWAGFAQIPFKYLPNNNIGTKGNLGSLFKTGMAELKKVWQYIYSKPVMKLFLAAFFFYISGVLTVMMAATNFGKDVLHLEDSQLITTVVVIQLVAVLGAYCMSKLSAKIGNFNVLIITVAIWIAICIFAYLMQESSMQFYILATCVGFVMGGIQSMSRSTYSKLIPQTTDNTAFFSFYDITEKLAMVIGLFSFGYIDDFTHNMRNSILLLVVFFIIGLLLLFVAKTKSKQILA